METTNTLPPDVMEYMEDDLYECITNGDLVSVKTYLKKGLDVNHAFRSTDRKGRLGKTLLEVAITTGQREIAQLLVNNKCNANLKYIVDVNNFAYFLKPYTKKDQLKLTIMYSCIVKADIEMIKLLVQGGYDVNNYDDRGCTALWHAVDLNDYEMTKAIVSAKNCDVNVSDSAKLRPLHIAAMHANHKIVSLLIKRGAEIDALQLRGWTPLILACRSNCFATVRILILNGADPNFIGLNGHTPLSTAVQYSEDRRIPELLLDAGATVDLTLLKRCKEEKMKNLKANPDILQILKLQSMTPNTLKTLCFLQIRKCILHSNTKLHLIVKVEQLPLPKLIKDFLLLGDL